MRSSHRCSNGRCVCVQAAEGCVPASQGERRQRHNSPHVPDRHSGRRPLTMKGRKFTANLLGILMCMPSCGIACATHSWPLHQLPTWAHGQHSYCPPRISCDYLQIVAILVRWLHCRPHRCYKCTRCMAHAAVRTCMLCVCTVITTVVTAMRTCI